ncbi:hypothetical protein [Polaromonas sp. JS666]|uniref:hypothetical protein n=1 Tax=Polaromonas sp. (strain JS666 / ATCC BAA-500) TaxID=296591 RepID=UPI000891675B|nr:hypothetical protein [Polaromonas sp. JS666]SDN74413.1 hypothetical protein SAMN05720382_107109 [Polaromonas sp. JS666]
MKAFHTAPAMALVALLLAGCASTPVTPGMSREQVLASYGTPTRTVPLASGTRLQYSGQPKAQTATMVDLDAAGKVVAARQVLNLQDFSRIEAGKWTRQDVEREFGPPSTVDRVFNWPGDVMTYRWLDLDVDKLYWVYLDAGNVVQRTGQGIEIPVRMNDN